ncbi:hypothetical protein OROGR_006243 [Orobanche gracilis]
MQNIWMHIWGSYSLIPLLLACDGSMIGLSRLFWCIRAS